MGRYQRNKSKGHPGSRPGMRGTWSGSSVQSSGIGFEKIHEDEELVGKKA